jgi:hypothetical protein
VNTLKQLGDFVGIPQGSLEVFRYGGAQILGLRNVSLLVTGNQRQASMRALISDLQNLTPITLQAQLVGSLSGQEPFQPVLRLNATGGLRTSTFVLSTQDSLDHIYSSDDFGSAGGDFQLSQLGPGSWHFTAKRYGFSDTGFTSLSQTLDTINVSAPQPPMPPNGPPPTPPFISVHSNGDGSFVVSGSKFLPNSPVYILVGDGTFRNPLTFVSTSSAQSELAGFPTGKICQAQGELYFEANDGRIDPTNHSVLMSNTVEISCPYLPPTPQSGNDDSGDGGGNM